MQAQFVSEWAKNNPIIVALFGFPIGYLFILFTKYCAGYFNGEIWPGRIIGFAIGTIVFASLSYFLFNESFSLKTIICISLSILILLIQLFWK
jgi:hypothetical protein